VSAPTLSATIHLVRNGGGVVLCGHKDRTRALPRY